MHVERVWIDEALITTLKLKLTTFFTKYLMPELLSNKLKMTGSPHDPLTDDFDSDDDDDDDNIYCSCREIAYGEMIACDAPECSYEWFHYDCVGLTEEPSGDWFCPDCRGDFS